MSMDVLQCLSVFIHPELKKTNQAKSYFKGATPETTEI